MREIKEYPIRQSLFTKNPCATGKSGRLQPGGILVHSVAVKGTDHTRWQKWDTATAEKCVHFFVDGEGIWQVLPEDKVAWHCGGSGNRTHISFEICEPREDTDENAADLYGKTLYLCVYLCRRFGLAAETVLCHAEAHRAGIASNHSDVEHWWPTSAAWVRAGYTMDRLRAEIAAVLQEEEEKPMEKKIVIRVASEDALNMREAPSMQGKITERLPVGTIVEATGGTDGGWVQLVFGGKTGWVWGEYLGDYLHSPPAPDDTVTVTLDRAAAVALAEALKNIG